jgi:hypothetical protein
MHESPGVLIVPVASCVPPWLLNTVTVTGDVVNGHAMQKFWHICGPGVTALDANVKTNSHRFPHAPMSGVSPHVGWPGHVQENVYGLGVHEVAGKADPAIGNCIEIVPEVPTPSHVGVDPSSVDSIVNRVKVPHVTTQY